MGLEYNNESTGLTECVQTLRVAETPRVSRNPFVSSSDSLLYALNETKQCPCTKA